MKYISANFVEMMGGGIVAEMVEAVLRTGNLVVLGMAAIYYLKISKQINDIVDKILKQRK